MGSKQGSQGRRPDCDNGHVIFNTVLLSVILHGIEAEAMEGTGLPGTGAGGGAPAAGGNSGPMGGAAPAQTTGPSGIAGPTASKNRTVGETISPTGLDTVNVVQRRTMGSLRCRLPIFYECVTPV